MKGGAKSRQGSPSSSAGGKGKKGKSTKGKGKKAGRKGKNKGAHYVGDVGDYYDATTGQVHNSYGADIGEWCEDGTMFAYDEVAAPHQPTEAETDWAIEAFGAGPNDGLYDDYGNMLVAPPAWSPN